MNSKRNICIVLFAFFITTSISIMNQMRNTSSGDIHHKKQLAQNSQKSKYASTYGNASSESGNVKRKTKLSKSKGCCTMPPDYKCIDAPESNICTRWQHCESCGGTWQFS